MTIQIRPCKDDEDGQVLWCETPEADYFGVYVGVPGDYEWVADFLSRTDAQNWAWEVAQNHDSTVEDLT